MKRKTSLAGCILLLLCCALFALCGCGESSAEKKYQTLDDFNAPGVRIGVITGSAMDLVAREHFPNAEIKSYESNADIILAVGNNNLDAGLFDEFVLKSVMAETDMLKQAPGVVQSTKTAFMLNKDDHGRALAEELNVFIGKMRDEGAIAEILDRWSGKEQSAQTVDLPTEGAKGTITVGTMPIGVPFSFVKDNRIVGSDIEIMARFCRENGYALRVEQADAKSFMDVLRNEKCDLICGCVNVTPERSESFLFTDVVYNDDLVLAVKAENVAENVGFFRSIAASFEKMFIREQRWKLVFDGILTTVLLSVGAALLGTILGLGIYALRRIKNKVLHAVTTVYIRILQGMPIVVLLMIFCYVVFGKSRIAGEWVAIFSFALAFSAYVCEMFRVSVESVSVGQYEAAYAMGFTRAQTFFRLIVPQAMPHFLPIYKGEFISLFKLTSVVGYIAVQDLTKVGDIIRARTYESLFPLLVIALFYFLLSGVFVFLLRRIEIRFEPKKKEKRKVKGVVMQ